MEEIIERHKFDNFDSLICDDGQALTQESNVHLMSNYEISACIIGRTLVF